MLGHFFAVSHGKTRLIRKRLGDFAQGASGRAVLIGPRHAQWWRTSVYWRCSDLIAMQQRDQAEATSSDGKPAVKLAQPFLDAGSARFATCSKIANSND